MHMQIPSRQEIRKGLEHRRAELVTRQQRAEADRAHRIEPLDADSSEQAVQLENDPALEIIGSAAREEIQAIDAALDRLAAGLYGVCKQCGGGIAEQRLAVVPYATTCERCAH